MRCRRDAGGPPPTRFALDSIGLAADREGMDASNLPLDQIPTPCFVIDLGLLQRNLEILDSVQQRTGATIILALKGFAAFSTFPLIRKYLKGVTASSLNEARLGAYEFGEEVHTYAVAYKDEEFDEYLTLSNHISFNSLSQWRKFRPRLKAFGKKVSPGVRINPEYSEVKVALYNPCRPGSRFGMTVDRFQESDLEGLEGLHFHTMCEQNSDTLARTLPHVEKKFGHLLKRMKWLNMGGGHHITRADYDIDLLCDCIKRMQDTYGVEVILEPGEAIALGSGYLVSSVVDVFSDQEPRQVILDTSATAHMPDTLEMPYRPGVHGGGDPGEKAHTYTLGGVTCLSGDVIGDWSFDQPLREGDKLVFLDMSHYTMVKTTTFNGVPLPSIALFHPEFNRVQVVQSFGYDSYRCRLS
jgi:carboxynorspermidine decarboxylase